MTRTLIFGAARLSALACTVALSVGCTTNGTPTGSAASAIISGDPLDPEQSGAVFVRTPSTPACSGTLLTNEWIITAQHCGLDINTPSNNTITMGSQSSVGVYAVGHPSLDFALLKLAHPFTMPNAAYGYQLPLFNGRTGDLSGQTLWCRGYGCNSDTGESCTDYGTLRQAFMTTANPFDYDSYNFPVSHLNLAQSTAPGDSGCGCLAQTPNGWALAGILKSGTFYRSNLGRPENWRDWAEAYVEGGPIPLPNQWALLNTAHPTFLDSPLPNSYTNQGTWNPCPGGHSYTWTATYSLESGHDYIYVNSNGVTVPLTGLGTTSGVGSGPLTLNISTDATNQSSGLWYMPIQCSDLSGPPTMPPPTVASNANGRLEVFARGSQDALAHIWQTSPGGTWSNWASLGSTLGSDGLSAVTNTDGRVELFARGADNEVWHLWQWAANANWSTWAPLGAVITSPPKAVLNADGRIEVFARGTDNGLWHLWQDAPHGNWIGWAPLGNVLTSEAIAVGRNVDGRLEVFVRGSDSALWHAFQLTAGGAWSGWYSLGNVLTTEPITVGNEADGRLEVFVHGQDAALWHLTQVSPGGAWSSWASLSGVITSAPTVASNADGRLEVFARGSDGRLWHIYQWAPNSSWSPWYPFGGPVVTSAPSVGRNADGRLEVFARGSDNSLLHMGQVAPNSGWTGWSGLGGSMN